MLAPRVSAEADYQKIMGNVKINDPLVLEERSLDLQYRNRRLESELKVLRQSGGKQTQHGMKAEFKRLSS